LPPRPDSCRLEVATKPPDGLKEFRIGSIPQSAPVEICAQFSDGGHELACPHLWNDLGQFTEGGE
jgi:hypothetical protein